MKTVWKRALALVLTATMLFAVVVTPVCAVDTGAGVPAPDSNQGICICETKCAEGSVNSDCPVCSAEGADLTACSGKESQPGLLQDSGNPLSEAENAVCTCTTKCADGAVNTSCPVCSGDWTQCAAAAAGQESDQTPENSDPVCICTTKCAEGSVNSECPVCSAEGADLTACRGEAADQAAPAEQTVTAWEWIGADNLNEGVLPLTAAGAENPVDFATVVSLLPTGITATVEGSADPVELVLTWSCGDFPEQATEGEYTFTAALPEGYALSADAAGLTVSVILGGGTTMVGLRRPQGEGIESNPYNIYYKEEMFWFAALVNGTLTDGTEQNSAAWAKVWNSIDLGNEQWTPIGTKEHPYTGRFTGVDQYSTTISGLRIDNATSYSGLFGYLGNGAEVDIFTVEGTITINSSDVCYVGGVAGASKQGSAIMCVNSNVDIQIGSGLTGIAHIGGILGDIYDNGTHPIVNRCINGGNITVGDNTKADQLGGIVGYAWIGDITNCANLGKVSGGNQDVGGIIGYCNNNEIIIRNCLNGVAVSGNQYVGGIIGRDPTHQAEIHWCYYIDGNDRDVGNGDQKRAEKVTMEQIASGYVTYMLNEKKTAYTFWRQTLSRDAYPTLDLSHSLVYEVDGKYTNDPTGHVHAFSEDGFCECGEKQPALLMDGVYQISNAGQLLWFANYINSTYTYSVNGKLMNDITIPDGYSWTPIANAAAPYTGTFDGAGHTIDNLVANQPGVSYMGFVVSLKGTIKDLTLGSSCSVTGRNRTGSICGINEGTITNCHNNGNVTGAEYVGGICGENNGIVTNCDNTGSVRGSSELVGGICGLSSNTVSNCHNDGNVTGTGEYANYVGGVSGYNGGTITNSYNTGTVRSAYESVGGVCGQNYKSISNCWNTGDIYAKSRAGGVCGYNETGTSSATLTNCYNTGDVITSSRGDTGGVCAVNSNATITNCYNTGAVSAASTSYVGGVCGNNTNTGTINNCYWLDTVVCDSGIYSGNAGEATAKSSEAFANGEVCYLLNGGSTSSPAWRQNVDKGTIDSLPVPDSSHNVVYRTYESDCASLAYSNTQGTDMPTSHYGYDENGFCTVCGAGEPTSKNASGAYVIRTAGNLFWFAALVNGDRDVILQTPQDSNAKAVLANDITIPATIPYGRVWVAIAASKTFSSSATTVADTTDISYGGTFDGQGHTISNLSLGVNSTYKTNGIFGAVTGTIRNLGVVGVSFNNNGSYDGRFGALCGLLLTNGTIENCFVRNSTVKSESKIAGAIAGANYGGNIVNCFEYGNTITGHSRIGHLVGDNQNDAKTGTLIGTVTNCYSDTKLVGTQVGNATGDVKSTSQFASGEVTYLLNGANPSDTNVWRQNLDDGTVDTLPVLDSSHKVVYAKYLCNGKISGKYSNSVTDPEHPYSEDGFCTVCGQYQPAEKNADVYEISNAGQLFWFAALVNGDETHAEFDSQNAAASAKLMNDITIPDGYKWTSIGSQSAPYTGTFDGANYTIDGLKIEGGSAQYQGFVSYLGAGAIQNLTLGENGSVTGGKYTGAICGWNDAGTITGCTNNGAVNGSGDLGGICGHNLGTVESCTNNGKVTNSGAETVGGICGYSHTSITGCTNDGDIDGGGQRHVGGIVGYIDDSVNGVTIQDCTNSGAVNGGDRTGGICGFADAGITGCTNDGAVTGSDRDTGGVCGSANGGTIQDCTNTGTVTGRTQNTGGVCGYANCTVTGCYNTGRVSTGKYVGGVCGYSDGSASVTDCYNTGDLTGDTYTGGVCGGNGGTIANSYNIGKTVNGVCGYNKSSQANSITNCYYLDTSCSSSIGIGDETGSGTGSGTATAKTVDKFKSGEVAYLLNGSTSQDDLVWYQNLDNGETPDDFPVLDNTHGTVYCIDEYTSFYSNDPDTKVEVKDITNAEVSLSQESFTYNGLEQKPTVTVTLEGKLLTEGIYYTVTYSGESVNAGEYTVTVTGDGRYCTGTAAAKPGYTISQAVPTLEWSEGSLTLPYTGSPAEITAPTVTLVNGETYSGTISYQYKEQSAQDYTDGLPTDAGTYIVVASIAAQDNYTDATSSELSLTIEKAAASGTASAVANLTYDGQAHALVNANAVTGGTMQYSTEQNGAYSTDIPTGTDAKTYTVWYKVVGDANHSDSKPASVEVTIAQLPVELTWSGTAFTYDGSAKCPTATVTNKANAEDEVTVTVTGEQTNASDDPYTAIAEGLTGAAAGNYTLTGCQNTTQQFTIAKVKSTVTGVAVSSPAVIYDTTDFDSITLTYTGTAGTLTLDAGQTLTVGEKEYNWTFTPADATNYTAATGTIQLTVVEDALAKIEVTTAPNKIAYTYGESLDLTGMVVTATYLSNKEVDVTDDVIVTPDTLDTSVTELTIAYGGKTTTQTITVSPKVVNNPTITLSGYRFEVTGSEIKPDVLSVRDGYTVIPANEYTVEYTNNTNVGQATVTIVDVTGGNYTVNGSVTFEITKVWAAVETAPQANTLTYTGQPQALVTAGTATGGEMQYSLTKDGVYSTTVPAATDAGSYSVWYKVAGDSNHSDTDPVEVKVTIAKADITNASVDLSANSFTYTGSEQKPTVTVILDGKTLNGGTDYTVNYDGDTTNAGTVTVEVNGMGNYTGAATADYVINKADQAVLSITSTGPATYGQDYDLRTSGGSGDGAVQFFISSETGEATINGNILTPIKAGTVSVTAVKLADNNYNDGFSVSITITIQKANYDGTKTATGYVLANYPGEVTLPAIPDGASYGTPACNDVTGMSITDNVLSYTGGSGIVKDQTYTVTVPVTGATNYLDYSITVTLTGTDKKVPTGAPTLSTTTITYGQPLSAITLSGSMLDEGKQVTGTFAWDEPTLTPDAGSFEAKWIFTPTDSGLYVSMSGYSTITVNKANAVVTTAPAAVENLIYTGEPQALVSAGTATGGEMQYSLTKDGVYSTTVPTATDAGSYSVWYKVVGDNNHIDTAPVEVKVTIGKATLTITGAALDAKTYDGTTDATVASVTFDGLKGSDALKLNTDYTASAAFDSANAGANKTVEVTVTLKNGNYALPGSSYTLTGQSIAKASVTISQVDVQTKTYDGTTTAVVTGVSFDGLVKGEALAMGTDYTATADFADASVGTGKAVTGKVTLLNSAAGGNYTLTKDSFSSSADISAAPSKLDFKADRTKPVKGQIVTFSVTPQIKGDSRSFLQRILGIGTPKVEFWVGETKLGEVKVEEGKTSTFAYDTDKGGLKLGKNTVTAKFTGSGNLEGCEESLVIYLHDSTTSAPTGDTSNIQLWTAVLVVSVLFLTGLGAGVVFYRRKRK